MGADAMTVTVLGHAGGCCRAGEACSGYLVRCGSDALLLDCGSGVAARLQEACPLTEVDHVVISHWHPDHCSDAGTLYHGRLIQTLTGEATRPLEFYALDEQPDLGRLERPPYAHAHAIDEGSTLRVGGLTCTFMRTSHPVPCLATRVEAPDGSVLVYTADGKFTPELAAFCAGADLVIAECSLYAAPVGGDPGHMDPAAVAELARTARPGRVLLSHLPLYGDRADLLASVRAGWDGPCDLAEERATYPVRG
jgi:ribonuclease BN (tRNA processing enzyme)